METRSVIVVSHVDFRAHKTGYELINVNDFDAWEQPHHECKFNVTNDETCYLQVSKAVEKHVRKHWYSYGLCPSTPLDLFFFNESCDTGTVYKPAKDILSWDLLGCRNTFIIVRSGCEICQDEKSILFIKFLTPSQELRYCGAMTFYNNDCVYRVLSNIQDVCGLTDNIIRLMKVVSENNLVFVDTSRTFKKQGLVSGSLLIVQQWPESQKTETCIKLRGGFQLPRFGPHCYDDDPRVNFNHVKMGVTLLEQASAGQFTDITLVSAPKDGVEQLRLSAHRNVLARVPYFRAMFNGGQDNQIGSTVEVPEWVSPSALEDFHTFLYRGCWPACPGLTVERLTDMLRLGEIYSYEDMMDDVAREIRNKYSSLTDQNVLSLLKMLETAEFPERNSLENFLLIYLENNFSRIGKMVEFNEAFGSRWYISAIDRIADLFRVRTERICS